MAKDLVQNDSVSKSLRILQLL
ncbi:MAG: hypothetical protein JWM19_3800, partial [Actinomycetia bacterium]|nr:hypothetical protein [Actinomycetes bacterium]